MLGAGAQQLDVLTATDGEDVALQAGDTADGDARYGSALHVDLKVETMQRIINRRRCTVEILMEHLKNE